MVCPACHYTAYPRIMPAVIVGVTNGDKLLITRYRTGFRYNALIAGFTENSPVNCALPASSVISSCCSSSIGAL